MRANCALGLHPEGIAFHFFHMANWAAMREQLRLLFLRGADQQEMAEEAALVLAVLDAPASVPRFG